MGGVRTTQVPLRSDLPSIVHVYESGPQAVLHFPGAHSVQILRTAQGTRDTKDVPEVGKHWPGISVGTASCSGAPLGGCALVVSKNPRRGGETGGDLPGS